MNNSPCTLGRGSLLVLITLTKTSFQHQLRLSLALLMARLVPDNRAVNVFLNFKARAQFSKNAFFECRNILYHYGMIPSV